MHLVAAAIALSGASLALQSGLARHRDVLNRAEERNADRSYVVADDDLARIAKEIEQAIHVPPTWHVVLRPDDRQRSGDDPVDTHIESANELLVTTLSDRSNRSLTLRMTLDAQWVTLGWAAFIGPDGTTDYNRRQFQVRTDFLPLRAIPIVLDRLESELDALCLAQANLRSLTLERGQPLGESPSVRCVLALGDESLLSRTAIDLSGLILLPSTAAHERDFEFPGSQGVEEPLFRPVPATRTLGQCFREARAMSEAIQSGGEWYAHVYHDNRFHSDSFPTNVTDVRNHRTLNRTPEFRIDSTGFVGATGEISTSIAGVPLTPDGLRQFLKCLAAAYDPEKQFVFLVVGCADQHELVVLFSSAGALPPTASDLESLRLVFDAAGSKLDRTERVLVRDIRHATEGSHRRWTCRFGDGRLADVWVHNALGCTTGEDLTSRARIDNIDYRVAGGLVETALRRD